MHIKILVKRDIKYYPTGTNSCLPEVLRNSHLFYLTFTNSLFFYLKETNKNKPLVKVYIFLYHYTNLPFYAGVTS